MGKQPIESTAHPHYKVLCWMHRVAPTHMDGKTGEVNTTGLAEAAAEEFDLYLDDPDATIPAWVHDAAVLVEIRRHERAKAA